MSNSKKTNEKSVTIADLILMLALAIYAVFTYFGESINVQSTPICILMVCLRVVLVFAILFALTKVKQVKNDFTKWRIVEYALLLSVVLISMFSIRKYDNGITLKSSPIVNAFSATFEKNHLISKGKGDIEKIRSLFVDYEQFEGKAISMTYESLLRADKTVSLSTGAKKLVEDTRGRSNAISYRSSLVGKYLENDEHYMELKSRSYEKLDQWEKDLNAWNLMRISSIPREMAVISDTVSTRLTKISKQHQPETDQPYKFCLTYENGVLYKDVAETLKLEKDYAKPELEFQKALAGAYSNAAVIVSVLIVILLLTSYFATPRSSTVGIGRGISKNKKVLDGGISLYN